MSPFDFNLVVTPWTTRDKVETGAWVRRARVAHRPGRGLENLVGDSE